MKPFSEVFSSADKLLLSLGLVGLVIYGVLLPQIHPDSALTFDLSKEEIVDRAQAFTFNRGYNISDFEWVATPKRAVGIIDSLKSGDLDRALYEIIGDSSYQVLPTYYWDVEGKKNGSGKEEPADLKLYITHTGEIWNFDNSIDVLPSPVRDALLLTPTHQSKPATVLDSLETTELVADFWAIPPPRINRIRGNRPTQTPSGPPDFTGSPPLDTDDSAPKRFDRGDAQAIAQYYLNKTLLRYYDLAADSIVKPRELGRESALVYFNGTEPVNNLKVRAYFEVTTSGVLKSFDTTFSPEEEIVSDQKGDFDISFGSGSIADTIRFFGYFLLFIFTFILFLRRLNARLIDVKAALQDAIWGGFFATIALGNTAGWDSFQRIDSFWNALLPALGFMLAAGSAGAFCVFIISCATDSIARAVWPKRLASLTLARNARYFNTTMGLSLLRSCGLAGLFLGLATLFMFLPGVSPSSIRANILEGDLLSPILDLVSTNGLFSMVICMMILLSIGATMYSKHSSNLAVIVIVTLVAALLQIGPLKVAPDILQAILSGSIGLLLSLALLRFDYFSCFGGFALFGILWQVTPFWLVSVSESQLDVVIAFSLIPIALIVGFLGLISRQDTEDTGQFVPTYLREMAQQERMRGELDIARQVQSSLLPRRMPSMQGVDIAAMCLPAQEVGGDYFDFIRMDKNRLAVVIGDVSGKGIQAGFFMTLTKGFLHAICHQVDSPAEVLTRVNELFCNNVPRGTFISLIYGILDVSKNTFTFARAGHDPVLFYSSKQDSPAFVQPKGMAIGLTPDDTFRETIQDETIELSPDDLLVFYTDGVTEAVNPRMEQFGVGRLAQKVESAGLKKSAQQVLQEISEHIKVFVKSAGRADDMTMVVIRIPPSQSIFSEIELSSAGQSWLKHEA